MPKNEKVWQSVPKAEKMHKSVQKYSKVCKNAQKWAKVESVPQAEKLMKLKKVCESM